MDKALWQQLQPLMDEALSLTAEARAPWLARIRVEAPTLAGELERLLEQQGTLDRRGFLETPAPGGGLVDQLLAGNATIMQRDRLGEALASRYTLGEPLGQGGMASVYRATDLKHRREVAIKVIRPDATTALGAERFLAEIRLTANLTHPNILPLLDSGEAAGVLYYVMPLVEGESLRAKLRREGALPLDEATRLLRVVAEALAHAHRKGLVHRDIKPDNVLLSGREAWVADFGIAKAMAATATAAHAATSVGVALGSPGYMAPEQIEASGAVDHRADLYSWGVMAWEVLAGRPPSAGSSMQQLFVQHLTATPEPLTTARPEVPPALAEAVMRCLAKNASDRFATADELLAHLDLAQASGSHAPVAATSHRAWVIGTGVVAAAAVAGALLLRDRDDPWGALRALPIPGDVGVAALSPAGTTVAFTRRGTPGVWVQPIDSVAERQVSREPTPQVGFVDDTTLLTLRVQRGNLVPARFVHTRTSAAKAPAFPLDSTGTWSWSDPGFITHLTVDTIAANQHAVVVSRLSLTGMIDSVRQELDVGERPGYVAGTAGVPGYVLASMLADSSLRFSRLEPGRPRRVVGAVAPNDSLRQKLANRMRLTLDGRYGDVWLSRDTIARFDLRKPDAGYTLKVHPLPAPLGGRARTGDALVHANDRASELWRVPIPADPAHQASMVSRTQGDVTEAALSPDQQVIARVIHPLGPATSLFVQGVEGGPLRWLIRSPGNLTGIRWSPDGAHLAVRETVRRIPPRWVIVDVRDGKVTRLGPIKSTWPVGATPSSYPPVWARDGNALYATSLDTLAPEIRRFALAEGDTGTVVYRGTRIPSLLDGLALHPDGTSLAVGGDELLVIPLDGGRPRTVLPLDTTVYRVPFLYQANGTIAFATVDEAARRTGAEPGLRELFTVSDRGGPIRPSGSLPTTCRYHIGLLRGDSLATCFNVRQVSERSIMHAGRH